MEPAAYQSFVRFSGVLPPRVAADDGPDQGAEAQAVEQSDWTAYSPDITRGRLRGPEDMNDPRTSVGWRSNVSSHRVSDTMAWTPATSQQPIIGNSTSVEAEDEPTPRANPKSPKSSYPHPDLSLPHPALSLDFRMSVTLNPKVSLGPVPFGNRNWISFTGGIWSGSWGSGIVLPGGQDSQIIIPDGSAYLDTNYLLQTHDDPPAHIVIKTHGWRTGPPEVLAQLADPTLADDVDPRNYKFRIFISMETGDERYRDMVNCGMWVGSGMRKGAEVIYDAYRVS